MATNISGIGQSKVINTLDTYNHTALLTSMYVVSCNINEIPPSGITIEIKQNGTSKLLTIAPTPAQSVINARVVLSCAAGDVIAIIVSSASVIDSQRNDFKGILSITPGQVG